MNWTGLLRWCHWRTCHSWWLNGSWTSGIRKERWLRHITSSNSRSKPQNNHQLNVIRWQIIWQNERSNYSAKCFIFFFSFESKIPGPFLNSLKWRRILFCVFLLFFIVFLFLALIIFFKYLHFFILFPDQYNFRTMVPWIHLCWGPNFLNDFFLILFFLILMEVKNNFY